MSCALVHLGDHALVDEVADRLEREVRVDRARAVAQEERHVVHLAGIAALHDKAHLGACLLADQVVVHRAGEEQGGDRCHLLVAVAVGQHDDLGAVCDGLRHLVADVLDGAAHALAALGDRIEAVDGERLELGDVAVLVEVEDLREFFVGENRVGHHDLATRLRTRREQVVLGSDDRRGRRHQLLTDGIERWVGHLGEQLAEVVEEKPAAVGERRDRRIGAHRPNRLGPCAGHGCQQDADLFEGVAERALPLDDGAVLGCQEKAGRQVIEVEEALSQPVSVRLCVGQGALDLLVADDPPLLGVDEEHPARL